MTKSKNFICIGHRGAKGYEPENTFSSFKRAIECGVPWIEFDVWNVENTPIVIHDHRLERLTDGVGYVPELTLKYLRSLNAGNGQQVPLLSEVLELLIGKVGINIELKGVGTAKTVVPMVSEYLRAGKLSHDKLLVSSFNHKELAQAKMLLPELRIGALTVGISVELAKLATDLRAYSINQSVEFVTQEFVDDAHSRGLKVLVFTVNHEDDVKRMIDLGVDGIFSDYPDKALATTKAYL